MARADLKLMRQCKIIYFLNVTQIKKSARKKRLQMMVLSQKFC